MKATEQDKRKALMAKYKKMFHLEDGTPTWHFGIAVGNGWLPLVDALCEYLQFNIDNNKDPQVQVIQIKEKFGSLRFYIGAGAPRQFDAISFAESLSSHICEHCGQWVEKSAEDPDAVWKLTLCDKCEAKRAKRHEKPRGNLSVLDLMLGNECKKVNRCRTKKRKARTK